MAPSQTLKWLECGKNPSGQNVEIEGTEPYIVGGHTASGYWIDHRRQTTIKGLYAAGDVAGGAPQKYVTGAMAEGEIAVLSALEDLAVLKKREKPLESLFEEHSRKIIGIYEAHLSGGDIFYTTSQLEEAMQKVMDNYAGGISAGYRYNQKQLRLAEEKICLLLELSSGLSAHDMDELLRIYELKERLVVCRSVIAHLTARKETRWRGFGEYTDYPETSNRWDLYINSKLVDGVIQIIHRQLVKGDEVYEHPDQ